MSKESRKCVVWAVALLVGILTGTPLPAAEPAPGKVLFEDDFTSREAGTIKLNNDGWSMADQMLSQSRFDGFRTATIGDDSWKDIEVRLRIRPRQTDKGGMIGLTGRGMWLAVEPKSFMLYRNNKINTRRQALHSNMNRWIDVRALFKGRQVVFHADGQRIAQMEAASASGPISFACNRLSGDFDDVRITIPSDGEAAPAGTINLVPNGSFEDIEDTLPVWWAPGGPIVQRYGSIEDVWRNFRVITGDAVHGKYCMELRSHPPYSGFLGEYYRNPPTLGTLRYRGWLRYPTDTPLTVSLYMKADASGTMGKADGMAVTVSGLGTKMFVVRPEWQRFTFTVDKALKASMNAFALNMLSPGRLWVDAIQIEEGTQPTDFTPNPDDGKKAYENVGRIRPNEDVPSASPGRAGEPITLDGKLDEPSWEKAPVIDITHSDGKPVSIRTEARLLYDDDNLYVAVTCFDDDIEKLQATVTARDGTVFSDDCVEVFFDTDRDGRTYYSTASNPLETRADGIGFDYSWNGDWASGASVGTDRWTVELHYPLAIFGVTPATPAVWGMNIGREYHRKKEYPCWAPTKGVNFHQPANYARLVWPQPEIFRNYFFTFTDIKLLAVPGSEKGAALTGRIKNNTESIVEGRVIAKIGDKTFEADPLSLESGQDAAFEIAGLPAPGGTPLALQLQLSATDGRLLRSVSLERPVLPVVDTFTDRSYYSCEPEANLVCDVNLPAASVAGARATLALKNADKTLWKKVFSLAAGRNLLQVPVAALDAGDYKIETEFVDAKGAKLDARVNDLHKSDYRRGETKLDRIARIMLRDGAPCIPLMNLMGGYAPPGESAYKMYRDAGFDAVMLSYTWHRREWSEEKSYDNISLAEKYGLNFFMFDCARRDKDGKIVDNEERERRVSHIAAEYPGLLGWLVIDEPWDHPEATQQAIRDTKQWDPNRVVFANHHVPMVLKRFAGLPGDAVSTDHYVSAVPSRRIENVALYTRQFEEISRDLHVPTWFFISGGSSYYAAREGTPGELTAQVYGHIAAGGNGLFTFIGDFIAPSTWKRLKELVAEVKVLAPIAASRGLVNVPQVPDPAPEILAGTFMHDGAYYIICSSQSVEPIDATIDLGALSLGDATVAAVLFESRSALIKALAIKDRFAPYERHVYRILP